MKLFLLLGQLRFGSDAESLLWHICRSQSLARDNFILREISPFHYCYNHTPASKREYRESDRQAKLEEIIKLWHDVGPFQIISFGWMSCDLLLKVGKSRTKTRIGAKWRFVEPGMSTNIWQTYDPAAALFDPNIVVDIAWVINHAAQDAGIPTEINKTLEIFDWSKYL